MLLNTDKVKIETKIGCFTIKHDASRGLIEISLSNEHNEMIINMMLFYNNIIYHRDTNSNKRD